ncbi:hypothetical protein LTR53_009404 [Teratosphaeriaceae sp. CCFEE 6253]|nr:hypothetical protein LTR53_009404 [Teratosphaeriaceae sp. CCFEE 6253]
MADFAFNPSAANRAGSSDPYDGRDYGIELAALPRSRAPSSLSPSVWDGGNSTYNDGDDVSLIKHDRKGSKSGFSTSQRAERVVSHTPTTASARQKRRRLQGWRFGVACSAWVAFSVLMMNLILTVYAAVKFGTDDGVGTAYEGSCETVTSWATWLHIIINGLSSILLSASNYTMQCLCSPTRKEIDEAHAKGDWVDIGVASVRNIFRIRWSRRITWWCLALSSIPIHLLYNSAIFKSLDANQYYVAVVSPPPAIVPTKPLTRRLLTSLRRQVNTDFLKGEPFNDRYQEHYGRGYYNYSVSPVVGEMQTFFAAEYQNASAVQKMSNSECISTYGIGFVSGYNHVLAITSERGNVSNYTVFFTDYASYEIEGGGGILTPSLILALPLERMMACAAQHRHCLPRIRALHDVATSNAY